MTPPPYLRSAMLEAVPGVAHGFFTRRGGVSRGLYESLNVGLGSGDDPTAVSENRARAAAVFGAREETLTTCYQIHSADVRAANRPWGAQRPEGDGVVTADPESLCGVLSADCAPVLIAEPRARVVAAVHAGWRGALAGVIDSAVTAMTDLGADPCQMVAAVGPCIGPTSYEVAEAFMARFVATDPAFGVFFRSGPAPDKRWFDLPAFVLSRLAAAGVTSHEWIGADTCAEAGDFFSNRRAFKQGEGDYGRLLSVIRLSP